MGAPPRKGGHPLGGAAGARMSANSRCALAVSRTRTVDPLLSGLLSEEKKKGRENGKKIKRKKDKTEKRKGKREKKAKKRKKLEKKKEKRNI